MDKKRAGYSYIIIGFTWIFTGIINTIVSINYFKNKMPFGYNYITLAMVCMGLAIIFVSLGIKKIKMPDK